MTRMDELHKLFTAVPLLALFLTIALGYWAGKLSLGRFVLGGISGSLLVGVLIGQLGVDIDSGIKDVFFALFIYAVGFQGGPQFFRALNLKSVNQLLSAVVMCVMGLVCVIAAALLFNLDRGTAAGLAAGGLTQSAIIGTAGDAIARLDVSPEMIKTMQTNIAVGYAVCYIFGSIGPIIMVTWFFPMIMRWDIREEAIKLATKMSGGHPQLEPGQFNAIHPVDTRVYQVRSDCEYVGKTVKDIDELLEDAVLQALIRDEATLTVTDDTVVESGDKIVITGLITVMNGLIDKVGPEIEAPVGAELIEEQRVIVLTNREADGKTLREIHDALDVQTRRGVYLTGVSRMGRDMAALPDLELHVGDELRFTGSPKDLNRVEQGIGYKITAAAVTDFIFFGLGMSMGILMGMIHFSIDGIPVTIGTGGGCLLAGLLFGWLRSTRPRYAALPTGASNFLRDFGLAAFVAIVGLTAGPQALETVREYGLTLLLLGVAVTILPQIVTFFFSYYVLRIRNPIEALGCVVGGRSANPGFAALLDKAGNATPVVPFTVTYAVANVLLTLWGPLIVGIITTNP
ncbi:MAG: aspartate-alanine antiporter [Pseudomonadota bacterium]